MSDFRRNHPNPNNIADDIDMGKQERNAGRQLDPFAPYDDPIATAAASATPKQEDFSAWRRPPSAKPPSFLMDEPAPYGAEMQQGGVPLFSASEDGDFLAQAGDAPTRVGVPIVPPQMVNRRKTVDRSDRNAFPPPISVEDSLASRPDSPPAAPSGFDPSPVAPSSGVTLAAEPAESPAAPARSRRAGRMARYHDQENGSAGLPDVSLARPSADARSSAPSLPQIDPWEPEPEVSIPSLPETRPPFPSANRPAYDELDPFFPGDSELMPEDADLEEPARPARRPALPGERYTGARTALPISGAPIPRSQVGALPEEDDDLPGVGDRARQARDRLKAGADPHRPQAPGRREGMPPPRPPRPGEQPGQRPPRPQEGMPPRPQGTPRPQGGAAPGAPRPQRPGEMPGQRPARPPEGMPPRPQSGRPPRPEAGDERPRRPLPGGPGENGAPARRPNAPTGRPRPPVDDDSERYVPSRRDDGRYNPPASVHRPRYDFEDEDEDDVPRRRRGCLTPIVILLLVFGIALAGVILPNWESMGGALGETIGGVKATVIQAFNSVKGLIFPSETRITGFSVTPMEGTAPAELLINVQTAASVTDLRFVDETGNALLQKTLSDEDTLSGAVTKNSKGMIWTLRYTMEASFDGLLTVQSLLKDGTWDEGVPLAGPLHIGEPLVAAPPVSSFNVDSSQGPVPAQLNFLAQTSADVVAVRVVDSYGTAVASYSMADTENLDGNVVEDGQSLTWNLTAELDSAYQGDYVLQYQTLDDLNFTPSEYRVSVDLGEGAQGDPVADGQAGDLTAMGNAVDDPGTDAAEGDDPAGDDALDQDPAAQGGDADPAKSNPVAATAAPTPAPLPLPAIAATPDDSALPSKIGLKKTIYNETKTAESYTRTKPISMVDPFNYAVWKQSGVLTFRGGPFRQNAAYGTVDVSQKSLTQLWKVPVGSKKLSKSTVHGIAWPGQPIIVKWPTEVRNLMNLNDEKKNTTALKEVILGGQDGLIYFLDLADGKETRPSIDMGAPSGGGASLATNGTPILGMGQSHSNLSGKQVDNGYHLYNLLNGKELLLLDGRDKAANSSYSGASGAAIFDSTTKSLMVGGQNGVLYTAELNETFDHTAGSLKIAPAIQRYKTQADKQAKKETNIDSSVAVYNNYLYYGDDYGVLQCVDINTLVPVWAANTGDTILATPALDFDEGSQTLSLYTANTIAHQGKKGVSTIHRFNALTGKQDWVYTVPDLTYTTAFRIGCVASPVVGESAIDDLVIFTASDGEKGCQVIALKKADGSVAWTQKFSSAGESSPVAVYNDRGDAWLVQAEGNGKVHLLDAKTGEILNTLDLGAPIEGSPAVYRNILVIGTTGKDTGAIYGIQIQ